MSGANEAPVIIKRKKVVGGHGHHGGAWKVAYADFVTAMMAFFMLMWLLNATTEKQRKGIADFFSPTIPMSRISGGGDGAFGGDSVFTEETLPQNGTGASAQAASAANRAKGQFGVVPGEAESESDQETEKLKEIEDALMGRGGESFVTENALRHVITRVTDEGLVVEIFDTENASLFDEETDEPTELMKEMAAMLARVFDLAANDIAVSGHLRTQPIVLADNPIWERSTDRARTVRSLMEETGLPKERFQRITGFANRKPVTENPLEMRNNRVELILLREQE